jgi:molybdopterin/thiamine biosynthesis adenylyltransferase/rhodanese-related sulfurtransferase
MARYARHLSLPNIGMVGQRAMADCNVAVVGAGGLGSPILQYLAAAGIGRLTVIDDDVVSVSNLQRQILFRDADVGHSKARVATRMLADLNPEVRVRAILERLTADNADKLLSGHDLVIDGTDNFKARYAISDAALSLKIPHVWGSVYRFEGQVAVFYPDGPTYRDLYPEAPPASLATSCELGGVIGSLCGTIGTMMATQAIKLVVQRDEHAQHRGNLLLYDAWDGTVRTRSFVKNTTPPPQESFPGNEDIETSEISPEELREALQADITPLLIDVREAFETQISSIVGAVNMPLAELLKIEDTDAFTNRTVIVMCKAGVRGERAARFLMSKGVTVSNLRGGIDAWRSDVEPHLTAY